MPKTIPLPLGIAFAVIAAVVVVSLGFTKPHGFDPDAACVGNQRIVAAGLAQYIQDYDERLPDMQTATVFDKAVEPYIAGYPRVLICPATGDAYAPNTSLSYQFYATVDDPFTAVTFKDAIPHPDGVVTMAFLDGHIEQNGVIQGAPGALGLHNAQMLALSIEQYVQDYDERFPPMQAEPAFQAAVLPYFKDPSIFYNPSNGRVFQPNPALSFVTLSSLYAPPNNPSKIVLFTDHDGIIAHADFHVTEKGINFNSNKTITTTENMKQLSSVCGQYEQDYNELFPPLDSYSAFEGAVGPYVQSVGSFMEPGTHQPYLLNKSISGMPVGSVPNPSTTFLIRDPVLDAAGVINTAYVDGTVSPAYYYLPAGLTVGSSEVPSLVWSTSNGLGSIWQLNENGHVIKKVDCASDLPTGGTITQAATIQGNQQALVWNGGNGLVNVETSSSSGAFTYQSISGPYDGWQPVAVAGVESATHILWKRDDGEAALWTIKAHSSYVGSMSLNPPVGETPIALAVGADMTTYVLFSEADGSADIWTLSAKGAVKSEAHYATTSSNRSITGFALGSDGLIRLLWNDQNGYAEIETLDSSGSVSSTISANQTKNSIPVQIVVGKTGSIYLLWRYQRAGPGAILDELQPDGTRIFQRSFKPYM